MTHAERRPVLSVFATTLVLLTASPACAWHIAGHVFCDQNGTQMIDAGDTPLNGVAISITALTNSPGSTFGGTTDSSGAYTVPLPDHEEDYRVELTGSGVPAGATTIIPSSGAYGVAPIAAIHLQASAFVGTADFLLSGCTSTPSPSSTPTASATPATTSTSTPSETATPVASATETPVASDTATPTASATPVATASATATSTATPTQVATPTPVLTPFAIGLGFQCYEVDASTIGPITDLDVTDRFGPALVDLDGRKRVGRLCNPTFVNVDSPTAPTEPDHLVGYVISARTPRFSPVPGLTVSNQFGSVTLRAVRPVLLLVPSAKSLVNPPPPLADPAIDHFQCYLVRGGRGAIAGVHVVDQFGTTTLDLKRPTRLCTAVDKRGEGILDPQANLLCYTVRPVGTPFRGLSDPVFVANQFGPDTLLLQHSRELCVPSTVAP